MTVRGHRLVPAALALAALLSAGVAEAGVTLTVNLAPDPVRAQEAVHGQVIVSNDGGSSVANVSVQVTVPATVAFFSPALVSVSTGTFPGCSGTGTVNCDPSEVFSWTIGTLPAGATAILTMRPTVAAGTASGASVTLAAQLFVNFLPAGTASRTVTVSNANALSLSVDGLEDSVAPGAALTYDVTYGNRSTGALTGTTLTFPVPTGTSFVSASGGGSYSAGVVTWSLGTLGAGESGHQQVVVTTGAGLGDGRLLVVDAAVISGTGTGPESATAMSVAVVKSTQPLRVGLEVNPDPVRASEAMHAQVTVTNRSGASLSNVTVLMRLPDTIAFFSPALLMGGPGTLPDCAAFGSLNCDAGETMVWTIGTLPAGARSVLSVRPFLAAGTVDGRLTGWEAIAVADGTVLARSSQAVTADSGNALSLDVDASADAVAPGATLAYDVSYGNRGASTLTGTALSFPVPAGATFVSASGGGSYSAGVVTWSLGSLAAGATGRQQVVVTTGAGLGNGELLVVDAAAITGSGTIQENARAVAVTAIRTVQPLGLALEVNPDPVRQQEPMHTQLTVTNRSGATLTNVKVLLRAGDTMAVVPTVLLAGGPGTLPDCASFGSLNCDAGEVMSWTLGSLAPGASGTLSAPPLLAPSTGDGVLTDWEVIALADGNNVTRLSHTVGADSTNDLLVDVDDGTDAVAPGATLTYTLTYGNRGVGSYGGATLSFPVPAGATLVSHTGGTLTGNTLNWSLGTLAAGQGGRRQVVVSIPGGANPGDLLAVDAAEVAGTGNLYEAARGTAATRIGLAPALKLVSGVAPNPVQYGQTLTLTWTLTNTTGASLAGVVLQARVPSYITRFAPTLLSPAGPSCSATGTVNCETYEVVTWPVGTLGAGASFVASMPPPVLLQNAVNAPLYGQLIPIVALAEDASGNVASATNSVLVNPFTDTDSDATADVFDNCTLVANASQLDANGDGFGNACDADLDDNGTITATDFALLRSVLGQSASSGPLAAAADLDGNGTVTATDFAILRSRLGQSPGPSAQAP